MNDPIVRCLTMSLSVNCYILGDDPDQLFTVKIEKTENVSVLKKLIKEEKPSCLKDIDASDLDLWEVSVPFDDDKFEEKVKALDLNTKRPLSGQSKLDSLFPVSASNCLDIVVKVPTGVFLCHLYLTTVEYLTLHTVGSTIFMCKMR